MTNQQAEVQITGMLAFSHWDVMRLLTSIQALVVYIKHDGKMELTRDGHKMAVRNIEGWTGIAFPRSGKGQRLRRERIALINAYAIWMALEEPVLEGWLHPKEVLDQITGEFDMVQLEKA